MKSEKKTLRLPSLFHIFVGAVCLFIPIFCMVLLYFYWVDYKPKSPTHPTTAKENLRSLRENAGRRAEEFEALEKKWHRIKEAAAAWRRAEREMIEAEKLSEGIESEKQEIVP